MSSAPIPNTPDINAQGGALPEAGSTTVDAAVQFDVDIAAYEALHAAAHRILERISPGLPKEGKPATIVFLEKPPGSYIDAAIAFRDQVHNLKQAFASAGAAAAAALQDLEAPPATAPRQVLEEAALAPGPIPERPNLPLLANLNIPAAVNTAVSLLGLLRADVSYMGRPVTIHPNALSLEIAHGLEDNRQVEFLDPRFSPLQGHWFHRTWQSEVTGPLDEVAAAREAAFRHIHKLSHAVYALPQRAPHYSVARAGLDYSRDHFEHPDQILAALTAGLATCDPNTGLSLLDIIRTGAALLEVRERPGLYLLYAQVFQAGGNYRVVRNFLRSLFFGDGASVSGGAIVGFALCNSAGLELRSGVIAHQLPYRPLKT